MQIPIPQSDNLYKFTAISGTIILILSLLVPLYFQMTLNQKIAETEGDINIVKD
jgi:hypothetical protein